MLRQVGAKALAQIWARIAKGGFSSEHSRQVTATGAQPPRRIATATSAIPPVRRLSPTSQGLPCE